MAAREDIDPKAVDVLQPRRRGRKRDVPEPSAALKAGEPKAVARALKRPLSPGVMFEAKGDHYVTTAPHSDLSLWELQLADAFGTRSQSVMRTFLSDLKALCRKAWDDDAGMWKPHERELNAALAMVADVQPRNTAEAALAAQMVAIHWLTMRLAVQALNSGGMVMDRDAALTGKLARTYAQQVETLQAMRGKRRTVRQSIKVSRETHHHQHIHVHRDAPCPGGSNSEGQAHDKTAGRTSEITALHGDEQGGQVVRLPSRSGKAGVS